MVFQIAQEEWSDFRSELFICALTEEADVIGITIQ